MSADPVPGEARHRGKSERGWHDAARSSAIDKGNRDIPLLEETTQLLRSWRRGSREAAAKLLERLFPDLRRVSARAHRRANLDAAIETSDLVQDLYLKLTAETRPSWQNRAHFLATASHFVRQVVVDHARRQRRVRRGGGWHRVNLDQQQLPAREREPDLVALDEALDRLERVHPPLARIVELRYFSGLSLDETASVLELSRSTVARRWRFARSWLLDELSEEGLR